MYPASALTSSGLLASALRSLPADILSDVLRILLDLLQHSLVRPDFLDCRSTSNDIAQSHKNIAISYEEELGIHKNKAVAERLRCTCSQLSQRLDTGIDRVFHFPDTGCLTDRLTLSEQS